MWVRLIDCSRKVQLIKTRFGLQWCLPTTHNDEEDSWTSSRELAHCWRLDQSLPLRPFALPQLPAKHRQSTRDAYTHPWSRRRQDQTSMRHGHQTLRISRPKPYVGTKPRPATPSQRGQHWRVQKRYSHAEARHFSDVSRSHQSDADTRIPLHLDRQSLHHAGLKERLGVWSN